MTLNIHIMNLREEGEDLTRRIRDYEARCIAYSTTAIQDMDQGLQMNENKELLWSKSRDITGNLVAASAGIQIVYNICVKLQEKACEMGVWE